MTDEHEQQKMLIQMKRVLDESAENLDSDMLAQLRAGRNRALAGESWRSTRSFSRWCSVLAGGNHGDGRGYAPAAYLLTSLAVVAVVSSFWFSQPGELQDISALGNLDLLTAAEEPEFYEQLDFYLWLEDDSPAG